MNGIMTCASIESSGVGRQSGCLEKALVLRKVRYGMRQPREVDDVLYTDFRGEWKEHPDSLPSPSNLNSESSLDSIWST